jgi:hypothetical protein
MILNNLKPRPPSGAFLRAIFAATPSIIRFYASHVLFTMKRKRSKRPGYDRPFDSNKIALLLLALLVLTVLTMKYFKL